MSAHKPVEFLATSLADLRAFPECARREAGFQIDRIQQGMMPSDWKPMPTIGQGVAEIRLHEANGAFRVICLARLEEAVYVLHCFQKKSQKTSRGDLELASGRYRDLMRSRQR